MNAALQEALVLDGLEVKVDRDDKPTFDRSITDRWAFCYTGTAKGNCSGIRFMLSIEEAQTWCSKKPKPGARRTFRADTCTVLNGPTFGLRSRRGATYFKPPLLTFRPTSIPASGTSE